MSNGLQRVYLIIAKQRNGLTCAVNFLSKHTRFEEAAPDAWAPEAEI
jgi:replicative DNA helicase